MLKAIGGDFEQCKRVENLGDFALPGQTFVQAASLHLVTSNWEESDKRWDAVSKEVRPLEDDVHGLLFESTADVLASSWI